MNGGWRLERLKAECMRLVCSMFPSVGGKGVGRKLFILHGCHSGVKLFTFGILVHNQTSGGACTVLRICGPKTPPMIDNMQSH